MLTVNSSSFCILLQARHLGAGPLFFFFNSRAQTCWFLLPRSFERSSCIISFLVLLVPFYTSGFVEWLSRNFQQQTRPRYQLKTADATDYCSQAVDICKVMSIYVFRLKSYVPLTRAGVIIRENFHPGYRISVTGPAWLLIWTHRNFYEGKRSEARSRKPRQPGWPGSYEEALSRATDYSFSPNFNHVQWATPQTSNKGSTFFPRCWRRCRKEKIRRMC